MAGPDPRTHALSDAARTARPLVAVAEAVRSVGRPIAGGETGVSFVPVITPEALSRFGSSPVRSSPQVRRVHKRRKTVSESSKWRMIGRFDDEYSIRRTVAPRVSADEVPSEVEIEVPASSQPVPRSYSLHQNAPNPFNPSTTIVFEVPEGSADARHVHLNVYDVRGRLIRSLFDGVTSPGRHAAPAVSVTPQDNIVAAGDTLVYDAVITNSSGHSVSFDVLAEIIDPNNDTTLVEEQRINLGPNQMLAREGLKCPIPETAMTGAYTFRAYTEILNTDHLLSEDTFAFSVYEVTALTPDTHSKVLISTLHDDTYPSPDQVGDRKIRITATIDPVFLDQSIYFRTYDPDDSSSYEVDTNANDNHDPGMPRGNLKVAPGYTMIAGSEIKDNSNNTVEVGVKTDGSGTAVVLCQHRSRLSGK